MSEMTQDEARALLEGYLKARECDPYVGTDNREAAALRLLLSASRNEEKALGDIATIPDSVAGERTCGTWQPIETAPKDGTVFDVWLGDAEPAEVEFYCTPGTRRSAGWHWIQGKFRPAVGLHVMPTMVEPTHWMSLPSPPDTLKEPQR